MTVGCFLTGAMMVAMAMLYPTHAQDPQDPCLEDLSPLRSGLFDTKENRGFQEGKHYYTVSLNTPRKVSRQSSLGCV